MATSGGAEASTSRLSSPPPPVPSATPDATPPADRRDTQDGGKVEEESQPSKAQRNRQNHRETWPYGNYRNYYSFRPASSATADSPAPPESALEGRLALLDPSLFRGKSLLDLGTNAGKVPLDALRYLEAERVVGVDIDPLLVEDARVLARQQGYADDDPRLEFVAGNFMEEGWFATHPGGRSFDLVSLFSVTKWLHLHHGDDGMLRLFASLYTLLPVGGAVIIEPQEWENYKRAAKKNKDLREVFKAIKLRPPFEDEMRAAGFTLETRIEREEGGFSRPLLVWRKEA